MTKEGIWIITDKKEAKLLRKKTAKFDFSKYNRKEIQNLIKKMREVMKTAGGIGLSANQIGLDLNFFIAQPEKKFYAIFNPELTKESKEKILMEEGCLSVPQSYGAVMRPKKITLIGQDSSGKKIKIKAWGILARVFQHEIDHLNGVLFIDKAESVQKIPNI
jgi:peptide deformylase